MNTDYHWRPTWGPSTEQTPSEALDDPEPEEAERLRERLRSLRRHGAPWSRAGVTPSQRRGGDR